MSDQEQVAQAASEQAAQVVAQAEASQVDDAELHVSPEKFKEIVAKRQAANREAQEAKRRAAEVEKKNAELEAKLKAIADKDKSETEKAKEEAQAARAALEAMNHKLAMSERTTKVMGAGVTAQYAAYMAGELATAQATDQALDVDAWLADQKKKAPAFFGVTTPAPASAQGGPAGSQVNGRAAKIAEMDKRIIALNSQTRNEDVSKQLGTAVFLRRKLAEGVDVDI